MIRVIHRLPVPKGAPQIEGLLVDVEKLRSRPGVLQAEAFRSLATEDDDLAVTLLFETEEHFAQLITDLGEFGSYRYLVVEGETEAYAQRPYALIDGVWTPTDAGDEVIVWPSAGPVSICIHGAYEPNEHMRALTAAEITETRREPGCVYYSWFENLELDDHLVLLEVWQDQQIYDAHWFGRMKTATYRGDSGRAPAAMQRGEATREFYRQQSFQFHYGRLLPADPANYSETVRWSVR